MDLDTHTNTHQWLLTAADSNRIVKYLRNWIKRHMYDKVTHRHGMIMIDDNDWLSFMHITNKFWYL